MAAAPLCLFCVAVNNVIVLRGLFYAPWLNSCEFKEAPPSHGLDAHGPLAWAWRAGRDQRTPLAPRADSENPQEAVSPASWPCPFANLPWWLHQSDAATS